MAAGKRREDRTRAYEHAAIVWTLAMNPITELGVAEFIRCGALPSGKSERLPYNADVEKKVLEIQKNGGRLIIEPVENQ
jgi:hypothetical protein